MSLLNLAKKGLGLTVDVVSNYGYRGSGQNNGGMWFFGNNGVDYHFKYGGQSSAIKAYQQCPPVAAIINRKAQAYINGRTEIYNTQGKPATSIEAKKIRKLLKNPNPLQSQKQFEAQAYIYLQTFGFCPMLAVKPTGFMNYDATSLWNIPPSMIDIKETNELWFNNPDKVIKQIVLNYKGNKTILDLNDIYIFEDFTPSFSSIIIPESRLKALAMPINNIIGAYESRNVLINYRGALGILSPEKDSLGTIPLNNDDKQAIQDDFRRYGVKDSQWQVIISNAALKWQQMGYATKDLMLFEEVESSTQEICQAYSFPYDLLATSKGSTYENKKEGKKELYQDAIIPESESFFEQWNSLFSTADLNLTLKKDFGHLAILQEDQKLKSEAMFNVSRASMLAFTNNIITLDQWRDREGIPHGTDGDLYFSDIKDKIKSGAVSVPGLNSSEGNE